MSGTLKTIYSIIKIKKKELDIIRSGLANLEAHKDQLLLVIAAIKNDLAKQEEFLKDKPELSSFYIPFLQKCKTNESLIKEELVKLDIEIEKRKEQIREAFAEVKRFEIIRDKKEQEIREEENKKESEMFDEVGITNYHKTE